MTPDRLRLSGVKWTMLITLYGRACDYRTAAPVLGDRWSDELVRRLGHVGVMTRIAALDRYIPVLRARRMDSWTRDFLARHPDAVVLQLACGLDSRAFRLDIPDTVDWYDLDFPDIVEVRRPLFPTRPNYHLIGSSVTDDGWLDQVPAGRPTLVIAEGLLMYLAAADVLALLDRLTARIDAGELIADVVPTMIARYSRLFGYKLWGLDDPHRLEQRYPRLTLVDDRVALADHDLIAQRGYRQYNALLNRIPGYRRMLRSLRLRIGPG